MAYDEKPASRTDKAGAVRKEEYGYNECIDRAKAARNSQLNDSNPMMEKDGFLGVDDLDKIRRRKLTVPNNI